MRLFGTTDGTIDDGDTGVLLMPPFRFVASTGPAPVIAHPQTKTVTITVGWSRDDRSSVGSSTEIGDAVLKYDFPATTGHTTTLPIDLDESEVGAVFIVSDRNVTVTANGTGTPAVLTVVGGQAVVWGSSTPFA